MIQAHHLCKHFGNVAAVKNVSFSIEKGQIYGLLGPNGAGKTTTLRMLYGLIKPTKGQLAIDGINVVQEPLLAQSKIGVLADANRLYTRLTAAENISYFGKLHGLTGMQIQRRTSYLCDVLDMGAILNRRTQGFSQGERMKVSLARALVHNPDYIILDEPTNGLDVLTTKSVRELLTQLKSENKIIIFSSHVMHEVANLCDKIGIIRDGTLICQGSVKDVIANANKSNKEITQLEHAFIHFAYDK